MNKILIAVVLSVVLLAGIIYYLLSSNKIQSNLKSEDVVFVSQTDLDFQARVKNVTGYDWSNFLNANNREDAKIAALLFLANEIDSLDDDFAFVNRSVGLTKIELGITRLDASDTSRENLLKVVANIKSVENTFLKKGLKSGKTRANRLSTIESFFSTYSLPEGEMKKDVAVMFAEKLGLTVSDYSKLVSLMIVNYNLFVAR